MEKHYTLSKAAQLLGVTTQTLRNWDNAQKIKAIRTPGNQRRIPESEISRLMNAALDNEVTVQSDEKPTETAQTIITTGEKQKGKTITAEAGTKNTDLLMCKDIPVYDISNKKILNKDLVPGSILRGTMDYAEWSKTRICSETNFSAGRLMQRAFGKYDIAHATKATRALSLCDCYWLKKEDEIMPFDTITPYLNAEWDGQGEYNEGSISALFVAGTKDKRWLDAQTLLKVKSFNEIEAYNICIALGIYSIAEAQISQEGLLLTNFTSPEYFFESMEQSGYAENSADHKTIAVEMFGETAVALFVVDYLIENNDRHSGNYGFLRSTITGEYTAMAPYYDFDWMWTGEATPLPANAWKGYRGVIRNLCNLAPEVAENFEYKSIIKRRAKELLNM